MSERPNKRMNLTRSAQQTDRRGPCRLSACWAGLRDTSTVGVADLRGEGMSHDHWRTLDHLQ